MGRLHPVRFVDVALEGPFWRERPETVLTHTIASQHVQLAPHGILDSLTLPDPPPPLHFPRNEHDFTVQDAFHGIVTLSAEAHRVRDDDWQDRLYRAEPPSEARVRLTALPYHLWNNRARGSMTVWVPEA